jgi:hypothetical protein
MRVLSHAIKIVTKTITADFDGGARVHSDDFHAAKMLSQSEPGISSVRIELSRNQT